MLYIWLKTLLTQQAVKWPKSPLCVQVRNLVLSDPSATIHTQSYMKCSVSMYFINELSTSRTTIIPKPPARTTGIKLNKSRSPRIRRVHDWQPHRSHILRYIQHMCKVLPVAIMSVCPLSATGLLESSQVVAWDGSQCGFKCSPRAPSRSVWGDRKKRKQKEIAAVASVKLVRGRRPLCCTYTCSTARTVWPAAGTERLLAGAGQNQQRYRWPGKTHTHVNIIFRQDKQDTKFQCKAHIQVSTFLWAPEGS